VDAGGLNELLGVVVDEAGPERVRAHLTIGSVHLQPMGLVHGGVYAALAESLASLGAFINAQNHDAAVSVVGLENHTTFLRAARLGTQVSAEATPRHAGRRTQSWTVSMRDGDGRELAMSTVRLIVVRENTV
jgi:1,4-dihydroxy-2-naphthoyl-CoA hydrolase